MSSITITFGDQAENHKGMQIIGKAAQHGFTIDELKHTKENIQKHGYHCQLIILNKFLPKDTEAEEAAVLVVKKGVDFLLQETKSDSFGLFEELMSLDWDEKALMYGRVVNKHARHNLCFADEGQEPTYQEGKGRIISYKEVPLLGEIRKKLPKYILHSEELAAEGNYYYDTSKCGIGFHGDAERKKVVALRLCHGKAHPIHYQWFQKGKPIGERAQIQLAHADFYVMSEKAVGSDWMKKNKVTLRHATGSAKFTKI